MKEQNIINLLNQMIDRSIAEDKAKDIKKLDQKAGESWMTFHLKILKEIMTEDDPPKDGCCGGGCGCS